MKVSYSKKDTHENHEVSVRHLAHTLGTFVYKTVHLFSTLRIHSFILMFLVQVEVKAIAAPAIKSINIQLGNLNCFTHNKLLFSEMSQNKLQNVFGELTTRC